MSELVAELSRGTGDLTDLARTASVVLCLGPGGVGKTTTAAALGLLGARSGRRCCVLTIDPAHRLADALGISGLSNEPSLVPGVGPGELWAAMLDPALTFDSLIRRYSTTPEQAEAILANRIYRNLSRYLDGMSEYMAVEKLFDLHHDPRFDLVIIDTPPASNAVEFLSAPSRLVRLLENRTFRLIVMPGRGYLKAIGVAGQLVLSSVARVVGATLVADAVEFFRQFEGMEAGFRDRARSIETLLAGDSSAYVLITSTAPEAVQESLALIEKVDRPVAAAVVNRVQSHAGPADLADSLMTLAEKATPESTGDSVAARLSNWLRVERAARRDDTAMAALSAAVADLDVLKVPALADDVHDLAGLDLIAGFLSGLSLE